MGSSFGTGAVRTAFGAGAAAGAAFLAHARAARSRTAASDRATVLRDSGLRIVLPLPLLPAGRLGPPSTGGRGRPARDREEDILDQPIGERRVDGRSEKDDAIEDHRRDDVVKRVEGGGARELAALPRPLERDPHRAAVAAAIAVTHRR